MIELTLADGKELDIPEGSILLFEEMTAETNPNFPDAKCFIFYLLGNDVLAATLSNKFEDILFETKATTNPQWVRLTIDDGRRLGVLAHTIISRRAEEDGCSISVLVRNQPEVYKVKETRRQIKKWSEGPQTPPNPTEGE